VPTGKPPGGRIQQSHDTNGFPTLSWEVLPRPLLRGIGGALFVVAAVSAWGAREFPLELARIVRQGWANEPDWFGLAVTSAMTAGTGLWIAAVLAMAYLVFFRSQPERFVLEGSRLRYHPGSALAALGPGDTQDRTVLWGLLRGRGEIEFQRETFDGVVQTSLLTSDRGRYYVQITASGKRWRVGQFLDHAEQGWLVEVLKDWQRRG
jgi:hypothetical protein